MKTLKIGFAGSPTFAEKILTELLCESSSCFSIEIIITQAPKKSGRGLNLLKNPVATVGEKNNIPVFTPEKISEINKELEQNLRSLDLLVVVAYGLILPGNILKLPIFGCLNIHPSLLPRWRGAAPIQRAIEAGDGVTGVCLIQMETGLDTGPIWKQEKVLIEVNDTYNTLENKLLDLSIKLLKNFLFERPFILNCKPEKQMNDGLTIAAKISKQECKVNWNEKVNVIYNKIRAFNPYPGVYTYFGTFRVKLADPVLIEIESTIGVPGTVMGLAKTKTGEKVLKITCGNGTLGIRRVKKEGGKWITARDYLNSIISKENIVFSS